jgi:hypothetical protein
MNHMLIVSVVLALMNTAPGGVGDDANSAKTVDELPEIAELPNPFTFSDGALARSAEDWARRREELKALFQNLRASSLKAGENDRSPRQCRDGRGNRSDRSIAHIEYGAWRQDARVTRPPDFAEEQRKSR